MYLTMLRLTSQLKEVFYQDSESDVPFNKHILIIAGKHSKVNYLERLETYGEGSVPATANITVEVIAQAGAQIKFSAIDRLGGKCHSLYQPSR